MKKEIFPFMILSCGLGHRRTFALQGLHIAVATQNCGISSKSRVNSRDDAPRIPPHKPRTFTPVIHHSLCFLDVKTSFLNPSFTVSIHLFLSSTYPLSDYSTLLYIDPLSNPVILHSLHMAEPSRTPSSLFRPNPSSLRTTLLSLYSGLFIHSPDTQLASEIVHLYSPNPRPLFLLSYHCLTTIHENRHDH